MSVRLRTLIQNGVKEVKGPLKIAAPKDIGKQYILPILSRFYQQYPGVIPYLYLNDNLSNIAESGMDIVVRYGRLVDSSLISNAYHQAAACCVPRLNTSPNTGRR